MSGAIPEDLKQALKFIIDEDFFNVMVYRIRDEEGEGWDGPRVVACGKAYDVIKQYDAGILP